MKNLQHSVRIVLAALAIGFMAEAVVPTVAMAAPATPQTERQKQAEKRKKEAEKAKAQKAKEAAKQKAAREKAKAQAQKEAEKRQAAAKADAEKRQVAAQKAAAQKSDDKAKAEKPVVNQTAAYEQRVKEIQEYNRKAAAYNSRDIAHRLGIWGQMGYSAIFPGKTAYVAGEGYSTGFQASALGGFGGGIGLGYQLRYEQFLFTTGLEFEMYNSATKLYEEGRDNIVRNYLMMPYPTMQYQYQFDKVRDQWQAGYLQLPVMAGMELKSIPLFWQAGLKVGYGVMGNSHSKANLTTRIYDEELIDALGDQFAHTLVTDQAVKSASRKLNWNLNVAAAAEIGVVLDQWLQPNVKNEKKITPIQQFARSLRYKVSLFAEYGFLNIHSTKPVQGEDIPMTALTGAANPGKVGENMISALETETMAASTANPFLVGVKLAIFYELPRKEKKMLPMPKEPTPRMAVYAYNVETDKPVGGAMINFANVRTDKASQKTANGKGLAVAKLAKAEYAVSATKMGYYPSDTVTYSLSRDLQDTLRIGLRPEPTPIIYTLCARVYDKETGKLLQSNVRIATLSDTTSLYAGETADDGLFVTDLLGGQYLARTSCAGYMAQLDTLNFVQDTMSIYLTPIKPGIKVKIENLFFATNKTVILPESEQSMSDLAGFLEENPTVNIHITGHTDAVGSDRANQKLSEGRAASVRQNLMMRGIDGSRITTDGKGESEPVATNDTEEGRALNRRVEFVITSTGGKDIEQIY